MLETPIGEQTSKGEKNIDGISDIDIWIIETINKNKKAIDSWAKSQGLSQDEAQTLVEDIVDRINNFPEGGPENKDDTEKIKKVISVFIDGLKSKNQRPKIASDVMHKLQNIHIKNYRPKPNLSDLISYGHTGITKNMRDGGIINNDKRQTNQANND